MNQRIKQYFNQYSFLNKSDLKLLFSLMRIRHIAKGEIIVTQGELNRSVFIILSGLFRTYTINSKSEEITVLLSHEGMSTGSFESILLNRTSNENIQAIEDSFVLIFDTHNIEETIFRHPGLITLQNRMLKTQLANAAERIQFFVMNSPEERFKIFKKENPRLLERVPQKYLASYLGMTAVSLSRIKSRVASQDK